MWHRLSFIALGLRLRFPMMRVASYLLLDWISKILVAAVLLVDYLQSALDS